MNHLQRFILVLSLATGFAVSAEAHENGKQSAGYSPSHSNAQHWQGKPQYGHAQGQHQPEWRMKKHYTKVNSHKGGKHHHGKHHHHKGFYSQRSHHKAARYCDHHGHKRHPTSEWSLYLGSVQPHHH